MSSAGEDEAEHWQYVARTMLCYEEFVSRGLMRRQRALNKLSDRHASFLPSSSFEKIAAAGQAARCNQDFFEDLVMHYAQNGRQLRGRNGELEMPSKNRGPPLSRLQHHRNEAVLHSVHREWSADGQVERDAVFLPLLNALKRHLPIRGPEMVYRQRVLIPGCGAGRLPLEVSKLGYAAEGNEFSAYMIMASSFMLNGVESSEQYIIYPFLDKVHNLVGVGDSTRPIPVPDASACEDLMDSPFYDLFSCWMNEDDEDRGNTDDSESESESKSKSKSKRESKAWAPGSATRARRACLPCRQKSSTASLWASLPMQPPLGMSAGDFNQIYGQDSTSAPQNYDCIMTCFFIDTAPNVIDYLDTIYSALSPGGVWINLGPLQFHWTSDDDGNGDERYERSLELSYEELKYAICAVGLEIVEEARENVTYSRDPRSISHTVFDALFFVARKPPLGWREARYEPPIPSLEVCLPRSSRPLPSAFASES